jgi:hypothetical protein
MRSKETSKKRPRKAAAAKAPVTGPVTLKQARAIAATTAPAAAVRKAMPPPTPANVAIERQRLAAEQERDRRDRIREYKATLAVMKKRGVKGLGRKPGKTASAPKAGALPLQVFAEGDSWFKYPIPFFGGGIIDRLEKRLGVPILNLAKAGDEVRFMLGVKEREHIREQLANGCPAGGPWDAMLFSGGGNDIVDNPMALWIREFDSALTPAQLVHQPRFDAALALVRAGYEDLIALRDALSPTTHLFFHGYDFAIADGRGVCGMGPWLKPTFDLHHFPGLARRTGVMEVLLQQFAAMLQAVAQGRPKVTVINTQGTLSPQASSWHNELHPSKAGFNAFAALFQAELKAVFPGKVL